MESLESGAHDHTNEVASIVGAFLISMKRAGILAPCHGCRFPYPTPFMDDNGHILCPDCELEETANGKSNNSKR